MQAAGSPAKAPPSAVSTAAWPRTGSVLAFIAANCGECEQNDVCDITGIPDEPCDNLKHGQSKTVG